MNQPPHPRMSDADRVESSAHALPSTMTLAEVARATDLDRVPFVLIHGNEGQLVGIVESAYLRRHLSASNPVERSRWQQMQLGAVLQWKIAPSRDRNAAPVLPTQCLPVRDNGGTVAMVSEDDVFVSWNAVRQSIDQALTDTVTSLPTRAVFETRLREEIDRVRRERRSIAVTLFDLDHFKQINDQFGHAVGDQALRAVAERLGQSLRSYDVLSRYGGDEYAAVCVGCRPGEIDIPIDRVQRNMQKGFPNSVVALPPITLSIGTAVIYELDGSMSPDDLMEMADEALYASKHAGRNCAHVVELDHPRAATQTRLMKKSDVTTARSDPRVKSGATPTAAIQPPPLSTGRSIPAILPDVHAGEM